MISRAQCVHILIGLMAINTDAYKRQRIQIHINGTNITMQTVMGKITLPPETAMHDPPLSYWDFDVHCKFQPDGFPCVGNGFSITRWYYDIKMEDCKTFEYYKCRSSNENEFKTYAECRSECRDPGLRPIAGDLPANAACLMQPDFGECRDYIQMYYFDITTRRCLGFAFSGCGGNQNRFLDDKTCQKVCVHATAVATSHSRG